MNCLTCNKETENPKFCSRSCAAIYNNKAVPKKKASKHLCSRCGVTEVGNRRRICDDCKSPFTRGDITLKEVTYHTGHRSSAFALIRTRARVVYARSGKPRRCIWCGYDKHFEVCHIPPISSFPEDTLLSVINDPSHLAALCRNHHWELDNGHLHYKCVADGFKISDGLDASIEVRTRLSGKLQVLPAGIEPASCTA